MFLRTGNIGKRMTEVVSLIGVGYSDYSIQAREFQLRNSIGIFHQQMRCFIQRELSAFCHYPGCGAKLNWILTF